MGSRDGLRAGPRSVAWRLVLGAPDTRARGAWASCRCRGPAPRRRNGHVRSVCRSRRQGIEGRRAGGGGRGRPLTRGTHDSTCRGAATGEQADLSVRLVPIPGRSLAYQLDIEPDTLRPEYEAGLSEPDYQRRTHWLDEGVARSVLYADCDERDARAAFERLGPQARTPYAHPCPIDAFPSTPRTYIVCSQDRLVNPDRARRVARERLDAELIELPGSHSPFLSRPGELAEVLHERAEVTI